MNCWDDCKYFFENSDHSCWQKEKYRCLANSELIITDDDFDCVDYTIAKNCVTCKHSQERVYETGTVDGIQYRCPFQNNAVIYKDTNFMNLHHYSIPECQINKWETRGSEYYESIRPY